MALARMLRNLLHTVSRAARALASPGHLLRGPQERVALAARRVLFFFRLLAEFVAPPCSNRKNPFPMPVETCRPGEYNPMHFLACRGPPRCESDIRVNQRQPSSLYANPLLFAFRGHFRAHVGDEHVPTGPGCTPSLSRHSAGLPTVHTYTTFFDPLGMGGVAEIPRMQPRFEFKRMRTCASFWSSIA